MPKDFKTMTWKEKAEAFEADALRNFEGAVKLMQARGTSNVNGKLTLAGPGPEQLMSAQMSLQAALFQSNMANYFFSRCVYQYVDNPLGTGIVEFDEKDPEVESETTVYAPTPIGGSPD